MVAEVVDSLRNMRVDDVVADEEDFDDDKGQRPFPVLGSWDTAVVVLVVLLLRRLPRLEAAGGVGVGRSNRQRQY